MPWPFKGKRDSGLLYHTVGPHGVDYGFWMRSQEFQIQSEGAEVFFRNLQIRPIDRIPAQIVAGTAGD